MRGDFINVRRNRANLEGGSWLLLSGLELLALCRFAKQEWGWAAQDLRECFFEQGPIPRLWRWNDARGVMGAVHIDFKESRWHVHCESLEGDQDELRCEVWKEADSGVEFVSDRGERLKAEFGFKRTRVLEEMLKRCSRVVRFTGADLVLRVGGAHGGGVSTGTGLHRAELEAAYAMPLSARELGEVWVASSERVRGLKQLLVEMLEGREEAEDCQVELRFGLLEDVLYWVHRSKTGYGVTRVPLGDLRREGTAGGEGVWQLVYDDAEGWRLFVLAACLWVRSQKNLSIRTPGDACSAGVESVGFGVLVAYCMAPMDGDPSFDIWCESGVLIEDIATLLARIWERSAGEGLLALDRVERSQGELTAQVEALVVNLWQC